MLNQLLTASPPFKESSKDKWWTPGFFLWGWHLHAECRQWPCGGVSREGCLSRSVTHWCPLSIWFIWEVKQFRDLKEVHLKPTYIKYFTSFLKSSAPFLPKMLKQMFPIIDLNTRENVKAFQGHACEARPSISVFCFLKTAAFLTLIRSRMHENWLQMSQHVTPEVRVVTSSTWGEQVMAGVTGNKYQCNSGENSGNLKL